MKIITTPKFKIRLLLSIFMLLNVVFVACKGSEISEPMLIYKDQIFIVINNGSYPIDNIDENILQFVFTIKNTFDKSKKIENLKNNEARDIPVNTEVYKIRQDSLFFEQILVLKYPDGKFAKMYPYVRNKIEKEAMLKRLDDIFNP